MFKNLVNVFETKIRGTYIMEDSGVNYIYNEKTNDLYEANNLTVEYLKPRNKYDSWDCECDNWHSWK